MEDLSSGPVAFDTNCCFDRTKGEGDDESYFLSLVRMYPFLLSCKLGAPLDFWSHI